MNSGYLWKFCNQYVTPPGETHISLSAQQNETFVQEENTYALIVLVRVFI